MMPEIIGIKELHSRLSEVADATAHGQSFLVVRHAKPVFRIEPANINGQKKHTLEDIKRLCGTGFSKDKNLSKKVDQIVYGV